MGKVPRYKTLGKNGECDKDGVPRGAHPDGTEMQIRHKDVEMTDS